MDIQKPDHKKDLVEYYTNRLRATIAKLIGFNIQVTNTDIDKLVKSTKDRYKIKDQLEATKQTLHNLDDVLIIFDEEIKEKNR